MSELRTNRIIPRDGLPSGSAGGIIQTKMGVTTSQTTTTSGNWDATALSVTITPTRSDSKILIMCSGGMNGAAVFPPKGCHPDVQSWCHAHAFV